MFEEKAGVSQALSLLKVLHYSVALTKAQFTLIHKLSKIHYVTASIQK